MTYNTSGEMTYFVDPLRILPNSLSTCPSKLRSDIFRLLTEDTYSFEATNWFLSDVWMADELEVDEDIRNGKYDVVNTVDELLALFDAQEEEIKKKRR